MPKPAYRKAFDDFIASPPAIEHAEAMEEEFYLGTGDRAAVILQASNVENILRLVLAGRFRESKDLNSRIFEGQGPLSSFSHKILLGYALSVYGPIFRHDLEIIKDLRNGFAHVRLPMSLTHPAVTGMCGNLKLPDMPGSKGPFAYYDRYPDLKVAADPKHPRTRFTVACHTISLRLIERVAEDPALIVNAFESLP